MIKSKKTIIEYFLFFLFLFASMDLFQFDGKTFFFYIGLFLCIYYFMSRKKVIVINDPLIILIFVELFVSGILAQFGPTTASYKKTALVMPILLLPLYFEAGIIHSAIKNNSNIIPTILKAIKTVCIIQFTWIPIQYLFYHLIGLDLNKLIFVETLGLVENASLIRDWVWYPSGFTYHSALIAPLMVIGFLLFDNIYFRALIVVDSFICGSSTALIGVALTVFLLIFIKILNGKSVKVRRGFFISVALIVVVGAVICISTDLLSVFSNRIAYLIARLSNSQVDSSTSAHIRYFLDYPSVLKKNSIVTTLFGYGYGCSGFVFSVLYGRENLGNWSVESEIMDSLYSRGIIGFLIYYAFLLYILIKGRKIDIRYSVMMLVIIIQGFGYNVQWEYIFLFEMIIYLCIKSGINIFDYSDNKTTKLSG